MLLSDVFTFSVAETQGVAMLSAVLRGAKAVEVSIGIMDAFVEMSPFSSREDLAALLTA